MLSRKEQLKYCKVCENRTFSKREGIICKLTNLKADFEANCDNYTGDQKTINNFNQRHNFKNRINDFTFGLEIIGVKNGIVAGLIVIGLGFAWAVIGIFRNSLHPYSLVVIVIGLIATAVGIINVFRRKKRGPLAGEHIESDDLLDTIL
jgi:hypothetical protein